MSNAKSINAEAAESGQPEPRKLAPGDIVQLKGGHGPKMVVNMKVNPFNVRCAWWSKEHDDFGEKDFHPDSLAIFDEPVPGATASTHAITASSETLRTAMRNGRLLIRTQSMDYGTLSACFDALSMEVTAHTGITGDKLPPHVG